MSFRDTLTSSYSGRFSSQVQEFLAQGIAVHRMYVCGGNYVHCHVCPANFMPPRKEGEHMESLGECPGCKTHIVFLHCDKD